MPKVGSAGERDWAARSGIMRTPVMVGRGSRGRGQGVSPVFVVCGESMGS